MDKMSHDLKCNIARFSAIAATACMACLAIFVGKEKAPGWIVPANIILIFLYALLEIWRYWLEGTSPAILAFEYLKNSHKWLENIEGSYYYEPNPDFTLTPSYSEDDRYEVTGGDNWVKAALNPNAWVQKYELKFGQTVLKSFNCIYFDEMRSIVPAPDITLAGDYRYFHLRADSPDFDIWCIFTKHSKSEALKNGVTSRRKEMPVIIFENSAQEEKFEVYLNQSPIEPNKIKPVNLIDQEERIQHEIAFAYAVKERFNKFKGLS